MHRLTTFIMYGLVLSHCSCNYESRSRTPPATTVPNGTPEQLLDYMLEVQQPRYELDRVLVREAQITAADRISADPSATAEQVKQAWWYKTQNLEFLKTTERLEKHLNASEKDSRPFVAHLAKTYRLQHVPPKWGLFYPTPTVEEVADVRDHVLQGDNADFTDFYLAEQAIVDAKRTGSASLRIDLCRQFANFFANSPRPEIAAGAKWMSGTARRLELPGQPLELKGKLIDGTPFDLTSLRGKIVLVQCWAPHHYPWPPDSNQRDENPLPKVKEQFSKYRDHGFDVVIVCSTPYRKNLEKYLALDPLPWKILFSDEEDADQGLHPFIVYYGLRAPAWGMLVDRTGNVISAGTFASRMNVDGKFYPANLSELLEAEFGETNTSN